jgi:hypothetical protein
MLWELKTPWWGFDALVLAVFGVFVKVMTHPSRIFHIHSNKTAAHCHPVATPQPVQSYADKSRPWRACAGMGRAGSNRSLASLADDAAR